MKKKHLFEIVVFCLQIVILPSCSNEVDIPKTQNDFESIQLETEEASICTNLTDFSFKFFKEAYASNAEKGKKKGVAISPISAAATMGMVCNAIAIDQRDEVLRWLNLSNESIESLNSFSKKLISRLPNVDNTSKFTMANSIWSDSKNAPRLDYKALMDTYYHANFFALDLTSLNFVKTINSWCSKETGGMIEQVLSKPLESNSSILWLDVLSFEGNWERVFEVDKTSLSAFRNLSGESKIINMMYQTESTYEYGQISDFCFATLYYGNRAFAFTALMPNDDVDFNEFLTGLNVPVWHDIIESAPNRHIISIALPKFEQICEIDLKELMTEDLQINSNSRYLVNQFERNEELSLKMDQVLSVKVDESGAKVAAVSPIAGLDGTPTFDSIEFNRPFVYVIHERSTGAILIMGAVTGF